MKGSKLVLGALLCAAVVMPMVSFAKPYQRFDENAVFENRQYRAGESICVQRRTVQDGVVIPTVQFKVVGINELNVERYGTCDQTATQHSPAQQLDTQLQWEATQGRPLYRRYFNGVRYSYSPGSVLCDGYHMMKVNHQGELKGTGRSCGSLEMPTMDPR